MRRVAYKHSPEDRLPVSECWDHSHHKSQMCVGLFISVEFVGGIGLESLWRADPDQGLCSSARRVPAQGQYNPNFDIPGDIVWLCRGSEMIEE